MTTTNSRKLPIIIIKDFSPSGIKKAIKEHIEKQNKAKERTNERTGSL